MPKQSTFNNLLQDQQRLAVVTAFRTAYPDIVESLSQQDDELLQSISLADVVFSENAPPVEKPSVKKANKKAAPPKTGAAAKASTPAKKATVPSLRTNEGREQFAADCLAAVVAANRKRAEATGEKLPGAGMGSILAEIPYKTTGTQVRGALARISEQGSVTATGAGKGRLYYPV